MIDISDGLAADAQQLALRSGVALRVELARLPLAAGVSDVAAALGAPAGEFAAAGGEDYELCFCADPASRESVEAAVGALGVSWVGAVGAGPPGLALLGDGGDLARIEGFEHRW